MKDVFQQTDSSKFLIISFLFEYENENVFKGEILSKKIENIVSTAEII